MRHPISRLQHTQTSVLGIHERALPHSGGEANSHFLWCSPRGRCLKLPHLQSLGANRQPQFLSYAVMPYQHSATGFSHRESICLTMFAGYIGIGNWQLHLLSLMRRHAVSEMCAVIGCVLVLAMFPTKGFPTDVNAEGMQQLKAFGRTTQSCFVSRSKGILKSFCDLLPRTRPSSVSISRC